MEDQWKVMADEILAEHQEANLEFCGLYSSRNADGLIEFRRKDDNELYSATTCAALLLALGQAFVEQGLGDVEYLMSNKEMLFTLKSFMTISERYDDEEGTPKAYTSYEFLDCHFDAYEFIYCTGEPNKGYVYLIQAIAPQTYYKIGLSKNPVSRIHNLGVVLPFPIEVKHLIQTNHMREAEKKLHEEFAHKRVNGEWFELDEADVQRITSRSRITILGYKFQFPEDGGNHE